MSDIGQNFQNMIASGLSPDGNVRATITGERILNFIFEPRAFERYEARDLERQLAGLAVSTWLDWVRQRREISRLASGLSHSEAEAARRESKDQIPRGYLEALRTVECEGFSSGHLVSVRTHGMTRWHVGVDDGTPHRIGVREFTSELRSAFDSLMRDRESKIVLLRADYFDIGVPHQWRARFEER
ncbi:hypothetical protein [Actinoplanes sp. G11-F43]|uniref:hypothetical protein n=1 Tax=Actinoplanes sp. G11-F43 TaxID=3424130 RepID=UPI003D34FA34